MKLVASLVVVLEGMTLPIHLELKNEDGLVDKMHEFVTRFLIIHLVFFDLDLPARQWENHLPHDSHAN